MKILLLSHFTNVSSALFCVLLFATVCFPAKSKALRSVFGKEAAAEIF